MIVLTILTAITATIVFGSLLLSVLLIALLVWPYRADEFGVLRDYAADCKVEVGRALLPALVWLTNAFVALMPDIKEE